VCALIDKTREIYHRWLFISMSDTQWVLSVNSISRLLTLLVLLHPTNVCDGMKWCILMVNSAKVLCPFF